MSSVLDLFQIGIGPSSSHTLGLLRAAARFVAEHLDDGAATVDGLEVSNKFSGERPRDRPVRGRNRRVGSRTRPIPVMSREPPIEAESAADA